MQQKIVVLLTIGLAMSISFVKAQNISGQVTDASHQPALAATVVLVRNADSSIVKTALPDASGHFVFEKLAPNAYHIGVTMIGFKKYNSETLLLTKEHPSLTLPAIALQQQDAQLKEVAVTAQKAFIERKIDRTVVNVDALISNAGTSAMDVLEKSPGVSVDQNGVITFKGKSGVVIYVDDKPTYLSGTDLENYLRSLPSSTIDQIELMPNPPAKYDAAGTAGVINIRTKHSKNKGFNGSLNLGYTQGRYSKTANSFNFTYRNNKVNIFGNLGYSMNENYNDLDINRRFKNEDGSTQSYFMQHSFLRRNGQSYTEKIGMDYYGTDKSTFGIVFTGLQNPAHTTNNNLSRLLDADQHLDSSIKAVNDIRNKFNNVGVNLNYRHAYDKNGRELTVDADYIRYNSGNDQVYNNYSYLPDNTLYEQDRLTGHIPATIDIYAAKTDYTHPLKSGYKLAAGLKTSYTKTDNLAEYFNLVNGAYLPDYDKSNHFLYRESINAAYVNANKDFKRLSIQAGLRLENTTSTGHQLGNAMKGDSSFNRNYTGLFPTLYFSYKLDSSGNNLLALNYGRRIQRPYYDELNPFISPLDKFTYYVGNPYVKPSYTHSVELSHTYKNRITTTVSYAKTIDDENETIEIVKGIYYSRPGNIGTVEVKSISLDASQDLGKQVNIHFYGELTNIHSHSNFYTGVLDTKGTFCYLQPSITWKLPKDWTLQADGMYQSKVTNGQFVVGSRGRVNAGFGKKLSSAASIKFSMNDIFKTMVNSGLINNLALTDANYKNIRDSRVAVLTFSYRFGKVIADQRKHDNNSAESEQNRVKQ